MHAYPNLCGNGWLPYMPTLCSVSPNHIYCSLCYWGIVSTVCKLGPSGQTHVILCTTYTHTRALLNKTLVQR